MVGGLSATWLVIEQEWSLWPAVGVALALVLALSLITEVGVVRPIVVRSGGGELPALVAVAAVLFAIEQAAGYLFGRRHLPGQPLFTFDVIEVGRRVPAAVARPCCIATTVVVFTAVALWIRATATGRLLRAVGDNTHAASLLGLPVYRIRLIAFGVGGLLAAVAGLLFAPKAGVGFLTGLSWTLSGFLALVVGGTGSVWAPLPAGCCWRRSRCSCRTTWAVAAPDYVMLPVALVFFAFRPQGLFVRRVRA